MPLRDYCLSVGLGLGLPSDSKHRYLSWMAWIQIPAQPLTSCMTLGRSLNPYMPQFLHLSNGANSSIDLIGYMKIY